MKLIINEEILNRILNEEKLFDELPDDILDSIRREKTSLGDNPAIPEIFNDKFLEKKIKNEFNNIKEELKELGQINVNADNTREALTQLTKLCKDIEEQHKDALEKICLSCVIDLFDIPEDAVDIDLKLVSKVNQDDCHSIIVDPIDGDDNLEFNDYEEASKISKEVLKRRLIDALCVGAGIDISSKIELYEERINQIDSRLCDLYHKIILLNRYLLFLKEDIGITDKDLKLSGIEEITLSDTDDKPILTVRATLFPMLLSETIRGLFDLFSTHGLPKELNLAKEVLHRSDYIKVEPWDMRIGPILWNLFTNATQNIEKGELPYLFKRIVKLPVKKFNFLMREIFTGTKKAKKVIKRMYYNALSDMRKDKFTARMNKPNTNTEIITDEYLHTEEL